MYPIILQTLDELKEDERDADLLLEKTMDDDEDDFLDDEEEAFMAQYAAQRMDIFKAFSGRPTFGTVKELGDKFSLVDEIDTEDKRVFVVVHIYETVRCS